jgi:N-acetylneuraminic acid mutarotase
MKKFLLLVIIFTWAVGAMVMTNTANSQSWAWEQLATLTNPPNLPTMAAVNGKIYVVSGNVQSSSAPTWEYDPASNTWTSKMPIPQGCYWATAVGYDGKIYVMGGGTPYPGKTYNFIYDPLTDSWDTGAYLLTNRMYHSAAVADGKIYLIGGQNGDGTSEWYFDEYNPVSDSWTRRSQLLNNSAWYCGAVGIGKKFYRIAGGGANPTLTKDFFEVYNTENDTWEELSNFRIKLHAPAAINYQDHIILLGGISSGMNIDSIYVYDTVTTNWKVLVLKLPQPRVYHKAAVIDNCIYVYGGDTDPLKGTLIRNCDPLTSIKSEKILNKLVMNIFPNPSSGNINLRFNEIEPTKIRISFINSLGQEIFTTFKYIQSQENVELKLDKKPDNGIYTIIVQSEDKIFTAKILILQ